MNKIVNQFDIISIHIPKTAGSSFQKTLEKVYGEKHILRLDFRIHEKESGPKMVAKNRTEQSLLDQLANEAQLDPVYKVIHGHFHYEDFIRFFEIKPHTKIISWIREPVSRVISNYNYLRSMYEAEVDHNPKTAKLFRRLVMSLVDFAALPRDLTMYPDYLKGCELEDYDFIGITENYEAELNALGKLLDWQKTPSFHVNKSQAKTYLPTEQEEAEIRKLYERNIALYKLCVDMAKKRK